MREGERSRGGGGKRNRRARRRTYKRARHWWRRPRRRQRRSYNRTRSRRARRRTASVAQHGRQRARSPSFFFFFKVVNNRRRWRHVTAGALGSPREARGGRLTRTKPRAHQKPYLLTHDAPSGDYVIAAPRHSHWDGHAVRPHKRWSCWTSALQTRSNPSGTPGLLCRGIPKDMLQLSEDIDDTRSSSDSLLFVNKDTPFRF